MPEVERFITELLSKHGILNYRTLFCQEQYSKTTMPKHNDYMIKPFTLTPHEKSLPPGLTDIALSNFHSRITLADEVLKQVLSLDILKKKAVYDMPATVQLQQHVASPQKRGSAPQSKVLAGAEKRRRKSQSAGVLGDEGIFDDFSQKKRVRGGDRSSSSGGSGTGSGSSGMGSRPGGDGLGGRGGAGLIPAGVLQPHLEAVFQQFWDLELEPAALATPFFGLITRLNCDLLGLPRFFDHITQSCSLADISVKLKAKAYTTLEMFEADFNLMFSNICLYFPATSAQHLKAKELQAKFRDRWTHVLLDLKKI